MLILKLIFLFVLHLCVWCSGIPVSGIREWYLYYPQINGFLKLHTEPADWLNARVNCHNENAYLASPWSPSFTSAVQELLDEYINKLQYNEKQSLSLVYSGALVKFPEGMYREYVEGLPDLPTELERCGVFFANGTTGDVNCRLKLPYVCHALIATGPAPTAKPGFTTPEYTTPEDTTPGFTSLQYTTPEYTIPEDTTPGFTSPQYTTPEYTTFEDTTSGRTTPQYSSPEYKSPEYTSHKYYDIKPEYESLEYDIPDFTIQKSTPAPVPSCYSNGYGYELANETMRCYKFYAYALKWIDANKTCTSQGATLAVINSDVEAAVLIKLFERYPKSSIYGSVADIDKVYAAIGVYRIADVWMTLDGVTPAEAGYSHWRFNENFYQNDNYPYGILHKSGEMHSCNNNNGLAYICEKAPDYY